MNNKVCGIKISQMIQVLEYYLSHGYNYVDIETYDTATHSNILKIKTTSQKIIEENMPVTQNKQKPKINKLTDLYMI